RHEAIGDIAILLVPDVVADLVALLHHLPGDVAHQPRKRYEQEFARLGIHTAPCVDRLCMRTVAMARCAGSAIELLRSRWHRVCERCRLRAPFAFHPGDVLCASEVSRA